MTVIYDENGNPIDELGERNEKIKENLEPILKHFLDEQKKDYKGKKKFGFMLLMQIENELGKYGRLTADEFVKLSADEIEDAWWKFHSLMAYYNQYFEIVPNRQSFQLYLRVNSRMYKQLQEHDDEDIRSLMLFIEDRLVGKGFSAGESGNANDKAIKTRLGAKGVGHEVVSASEELVVQAVATKSAAELEREMSQILGKDFNLLSGKK
jgi:hypothetical protein